MTGALGAIKESAAANKTPSNGPPREGAYSPSAAGAASAATSPGGVEVLVSAGPASTNASPTVADRQYSSGDEGDRPPSGFTPEGSKVSFLKRASRRIRRSIYSGGGPPMGRESYYRDSLIAPAMLEAAQAADGRTCMPLTALRRRLLPMRWQQAASEFCDFVPWHIFILLITLFGVFAPDIATIVSAPDYTINWINGFILGIVGMFAVETAIYISCRERVVWLQVVLDVISNVSLLFAVTWFTDALGLRSDGTTSDAARACRILRLVRVASVVEVLGWKARQWFDGRAKAREEAGSQSDKLEPSNIGRRIGEITTLQVALVVVGTVVGTSLLVGADLNSGGSEGLEAFASALAALAGAGAAYPELNATVAAMLDFSRTSLASKQVPMLLTVNSSAGGTFSWDWMVENGGWTRHSPDRLDIYYPSVSSPAPPPLVHLSVSVEKANHLRARYNMLLALVVICLLLSFVLLLNYSIWKMLVEPLDRIFNTIRTNAAQVVAALGPDVGRQGVHGHGHNDGGRSSKKDDLDMHTIEAAVEKMSRILEQYTSTGGVGLNTVKKMATTADQSTKEWLATMVAGPASDEVVNGRNLSSSSAGGSFASRAGLQKKGGGRGTPGTPGTPGSPPAPQQQQQVSPGPGQPLRPRQSRLGRMSDIKLQDVQQAQQQMQQQAKQQAQQRQGQQQAQQQAPPPQLQQLRATNERLLDSQKSSLQQFLERPSESGSQQDPAGPPQDSGTARSGSGTGAVGGGSALSGRDRSGSGAAAAAVAPSAPSAHSVESDSAAVSALVAALPGPEPQRRVSSSLDPWEGVSSSTLSEAQKALLSQVDLDYLHSFSFDALAVPAPLLVPYVCAMFLELDLAFFCDSNGDPDEQEGPGFVDVLMLWRFVEEVSGIYKAVPYHNFNHCTDVTHTTFMFIKRVGHKVALSGLERFALMVAAISHDLDHPGLNNAFLVNTRDPLAFTYNDSSVLENRHIACLYGLMLNKPHLNIFARLDANQWREVRKAVIGAILSTDMVHHFPMVSRLEVFYELHAATIHAHHRALRQGLSRDGLLRLFDSAEERQLLLNLLLHCADISNPVKPTDIAEKWSERVLGEFFAQGDRERAAGMAISPMCDRSKTSRASSQINFIEFVVAPIYAQVYKIFPELGEVVDNLIANRHFWQDELSAELSASGGTVPGTGDPLTPERRAEEVVKAEKRLRDFQAKYREILSRRKHQLSRLLASGGSRSALFPRPAGGTGGSGNFQRLGSLQQLVEQSENSTGNGWDKGGRSGGGAGGGAMSALLGRVGRALTQGSSGRGQGSTGNGSGASIRTSNASDLAGDLAALQQQRGEHASHSSAGWLGGGNKVVPSDAV